MGYSKAPTAATEQRLNQCVCPLRHRRDANTRHSALDWFIPMRYRGRQITNDLHCAMDVIAVLCCVMLYPSAAFDTVSHSLEQDEGDTWGEILCTQGLQSYLFRHNQLYDH